VEGISLEELVLFCLGVVAVFEEADDDIVAE
jgi:hypothetical protein